MSLRKTKKSHKETEKSPQIAVILESSSESSLNLKTALDQTVSALDSKILKTPITSKIEEGVKIKIDTNMLISEDFKKFVYEVNGLPLTPQMKALGIKGVAFESQQELEKYGPQLGVPVKLEEFLHLSQKNLTLEQAFVKAKKGKTSYTSLRLAGLWRDLNVIYATGVFQTEPTLKVLGQFSHLAKKLKGECDLGQVMARVIRDWIDFGKFLKDQGLVLDYPTKPEVGWFLQHCGMAVEFSKKLSSPSVSGGLKPFVPGEYQ
jgi:hypothetical protein